MSKRAGIYVRVSLPHLQDAEDKVSIEKQLADCEEYCAQCGYTVAVRYVENQRYRVKGRLVDPSGTRSDRPQYQAMLAAARRGDIDVIVSWKEDRLCRGVYAAVPLGRVLEETRVTVELVKETFDLGMFFIKAAIGKIEVDNIRDRMTMGVKARLEQGRAWEVHRRYGYAVGDDGQLIYDEERAPWVAQMYEWGKEGLSAVEIRRRLLANEAPEANRAGGPPQRKVPWPVATVHHILTAAAYWQGYVEAHRDGMVYQLPCPPIVDRETYDLVQAIRRQNRSHAELLLKDDFLCSGLVTCADKRTWGARTNRWRGKGIVRKSPLGIYYCPGKSTHPDIYDHPDCPRTAGSKKLDTYVWEQVSEILEHPSLIREALDAEIERLHQSEHDAEEELQHVQQHLDNLMTERHWVITQARKGRITDDDMDLQLGALQLQEEALRREYSEKSAIAAYRQRAQELADFAEEYLSDIHDGVGWLNQDASTVGEERKKAIFEGRRHIVRLLVDRIVMHREWPPEVMFAINVRPEGSSESNESHTVEFAPYRLVFSLRHAIHSSGSYSVVQQETDDHR